MYNTSQMFAHFISLSILNKTTSRLWWAILCKGWTIRKVMCRLENYQTAWNIYASAEILFRVLGVYVFFEMIFPFTKIYIFFVPLLDLLQVDLLASGASLVWPRSGRPRATKSREVDLSRLMGFHSHFAPKMGSGVTRIWSFRFHLRVLDFNGRMCWFHSD